jgi:hypothetical protein
MNEDKEGIMLLFVGFVLIFAYLFGIGQNHSGYLEGYKDGYEAHINESNIH